MNSSVYIPISVSALSTAAELARQCSATTVRERVLVSQVVTLAVREYLHRTAGLQTGTGRSALLKYVELLDICDFNTNDWRVEMRVVTHVEQLALYVPTVPLMVGVLSDFYIAAQVEKDLTGAEMLGYARCADLAEAELSANGLFAMLPLEELQPFETLPEQLQKARTSDASQEHAFEIWQARADRIMRAVSEVLAQEGAFESDHIGRLAAGLRDDILSIYGKQLPETRLEPLFERLFRRFGIASPVPASPTSPVAFQNRIEDHTKFSSPTTRAQFFTDALVVSERVALYRYLLGADAALEEHRRLRRVFDRATAGRHQASSRRRTQLHTWHEHRDSMAESIYELPTASPAASAMMPSLDFSSECSMNIFEFRNQI